MVRSLSVSGRSVIILKKYLESCLKFCNFEQ